MKTGIIVALLFCGLLLRMQGWQFCAQKQTLRGFLLVIGGTLVTLSIVAVLATSTGV
jgi:hypothetical protein